MNTTIRSLMAAALLAAPMVSTTAFAAKDPCKGVKVKKSKFGESRQGEAGDFKLIKTKGEYTLQVGFNAGGGYGAFAANTLQILPEGTKVEVLMADGSSIELATLHPASSQIVSIMGVSVTHYDLTFYPDMEVYKTLFAQPIDAYRVYMPGEPVDNSVSKGDAKKMAEIGSCMLGT